MLKKTTFISVLILLSLLIVSCATGPSEQKTDTSFIGDYEVIELEIAMLNTVPQNAWKLVAREVSISFYPQTNLVHYRFKYDMNNISLYLDESARRSFSEALEQYLEQYQNGLLTKKQAGKKALFGDTPVWMQWGLLGPSYTANPKLRFEFFFITDDKPYFIAANASSSETYTDGSIKKGGTNSPAIKLALSPIQAKHMVQLMNQEYLVSLVEAKNAEALDFDLPADEGAPAPAYDPEAAF